MSIKKAFIEIHTFLEANKDKKVRTIMDEITELLSAKGAGGSATSVYRDEAGVVTFINDYYFKLWMPLSHVEFGAKANSSSGFNTMCKEGTSHWTKQQRDFKKGKEDLLDQVASGEIQPSDIEAHLASLEDARKFIAPHSAGIGFATIEEALAATTEELDALVQARTDKYLADMEEIEVKADEVA